MEKCGHVKRETGPVQGRAGVGPAFRSSVTSVSYFVGWAKARSAVPTLYFPLDLTAWASLRSAPPYKIEGSGTPANAGSPTAASCDAARALLERARLTAFHHGSHLRELFHPKGSASGQASWDAVCAGVTRLRLSQSREAPPTPVIMPGDMMPKPPGSRLQTRPRAPPPLP